MNKDLQEVSLQLKIDIPQIETTLKLLSEGSTVPFISRYRKDMTGGLDEEQIEQINILYKYSQELSKRKEAIIKLLEEKGLLTDEIKVAVLNSKKKSELENIYEPFKSGKKTKATDAIALGLEPLAITILNANNSDFNPFHEASKFVNEKVINEDFAIEQVKYIIAQVISRDLNTRHYLKEQALNFGVIKTKAKRGYGEKDPQEKFKNYYDNQEKVSKIPNHRVMAINRAVKQKIINLSFELNNKKIEYDLNNKYFKIKTTGKIISDALLDALKRLLLPAIEREVWNDLFEKANHASIKNFSESLEQILLAPAMKGKRVLALDPAFISGCKIAVLDFDGQVLEIDKIYPNKPLSKITEAKSKLISHINKYKIEIIVIGNGTASRETEAFVEQVTKEITNLEYKIVSEIGASVYSASKSAIKEFPNFSVEERSAVNIGRRFQDPLNELVKVDPKSLGIGQYQHDVNQKELSEALTFKTEKVINQVGVDANSATEEILTYVSGLSNKHATNIVQYRLENGDYKSRKDLKKVKGLGAKSYEQAIGFIRIHNSEEFLDKTPIHPESYKLAKAIIKHLKIDLNNLNPAELEKINRQELIEKFDVKKFELDLLLESIYMPTKDIRDSKEGLTIDSRIKNFKDLKEGMVLKGNVLNITDFGVFVYVGIKESVLIHISNLADKFVLHPSEIVKQSEIVKLKILSIDPERKRIQGKLIKD